MDVFDDSLCAGNPHKNECYEIFDDNESFFHEWFFTGGRENFLEQICFGRVKDCTAALLASKQEPEPKSKIEQAPLQQKNQVVLNPNEELKTAHPEIFEKMAAAAAHSTKSCNRNGCYTLEISKAMIVPALAVSLIVALLIAAYVFATRVGLSSKPADDGEPIKRVGRRGSYKML